MQWFTSLHIKSHETRKISSSLKIFSASGHRSTSLKATKILLTIFSGKLESLIATLTPEALLAFPRCGSRVFIRLSHLGDKLRFILRLHEHFTPRCLNETKTTTAHINFASYEVFKLKVSSRKEIWGEKWGSCTEQNFFLINYPFPSTALHIHGTREAGKCEKVKFSFLVVPKVFLSTLWAILAFLLDSGNSLMFHNQNSPRSTEE